MNAPITLETLLATYWQAKTAADQAADHLEKIKEAVLSMMPCNVAEGTESLEIDDAKISVTHKLNRTVDNAALQAGWATADPFVQKCFNWKPEVSLKALRAAEELAPAIYAEAAKFITTKPAKPWLKIERK